MNVRRESLRDTLVTKLSKFGMLANPFVVVMG